MAEERPPVIGGRIGSLTICRKWLAWSASGKKLVLGFVPSLIEVGGANVGDRLADELDFVVGLVRISTILVDIDTNLNV